MKRLNVFLAVFCCFLAFFSTTTNARDFVGFPKSLWAGHLPAGQWASLAEQPAVLIRSRGGDDFFIFNFGERDGEGKFQFFQLPPFDKKIGEFGWVNFPVAEAKKVSWLTWEEFKSKICTLLVAEEAEILPQAVAKYLLEDVKADLQFAFTLEINDWRLGNNLLAAALTWGATDAVQVRPYIKELQKIVNATPDGKAGPKTLAGVATFLIKGGSAEMLARQPLIEVAKHKTAADQHLTFAEAEALPLELYEEASQKAQVRIERILQKLAAIDCPAARRAYFELLRMQQMVGMDSTIDAGIFLKMLDK